MRYDEWQKGADDLRRRDREEEWRKAENEAMRRRDAHWDLGKRSYGISDRATADIYGDNGTVGFRFRQGLGAVDMDYRTATGAEFLAMAEIRLMWERWRDGGLDDLPPNGEWADIRKTLK